MNLFGNIPKPKMKTKPTHFCCAGWGQTECGIILFGFPALKISNQKSKVTCKRCRKRLHIIPNKVVALVSEAGSQRGELDRLTIQNRDLSRIVENQMREIADLKEHARGYRVELNRRGGFQLQDAEDAKKFRRLKAIIEEKP